MFILQLLIRTNKQGERKANKQIQNDIYFLFVQKKKVILCVQNFVLRRGEWGKLKLKIRIRRKINDKELLHQDMNQVVPIKKKVETQI